LNHVYIGLGSNLGDRYHQIKVALGYIQQLPNTQILQCARIYETKPLGHSLHWYLNTVIHVKTNLAPKELLDKLLDIEQHMGRVRSVKFADRIIDLDLLLYAQQTNQDPHCTLPHPGLHERCFVLAPLFDIAPDLYLATHKKTIAQLWQQHQQQHHCNDDMIRLFKNDLTPPGHLLY